MKLTVLILAILSSQVASAGALPNPLVCAEKDSYASRQIVIEHNQHRGVAKVFNYDGIEVLEEFSVELSLTDGYIPTLRIQNWDWHPRLNINLHLEASGAEGSATIVSHKLNSDLNLSCQL